MFQHVNQQLPEAFDRRDVHLLPRRVGAANGGTEGDHVPLRVGTLEQTALETGVDHHDVRHLAEQGLVAVAYQRHHRGVHIRGPARVGAGELAAGAGQGEQGTGHLLDVLAAGVDE